MFLFQGTNINDVVLLESVPSTLLLDKHIAFIISYSKKTDDYVCRLTTFGLIVHFELFSTTLTLSLNYITVNKLNKWL